MAAKVDLWQKSLCPVIEITWISDGNCDTYHKAACDAALPLAVTEP
jgi:hypothetical protein